MPLDTTATGGRGEYQAVLKCSTQNGKNWPEHSRASPKGKPQRGLGIGYLCGQDAAAGQNRGVRKAPGGRRPSSWVSRKVPVPQDADRPKRKCPALETPNGFGGSAALAGTWTFFLAAPQPKRFCGPLCKLLPWESVFAKAQFGIGPHPRLFPQGSCNSRPIFPSSHSAFPLACSHISVHAHASDFQQFCLLRLLTQKKHSKTDSHGV
ncbi:hypothetical protein B0J18DRAFT_226454 [Chaetomium sp. MPI-SDFR-AT-0129]|nr:hypothetical protein B0J18DRAFT_226454 [Chaetomium sp. MPI-SDFR-AT-0129]